MDSNLASYALALSKRPSSNLNSLSHSDRLLHLDRDLKPIAGRHECCHLRFAALRANLYFVFRFVCLPDLKRKLLRTENVHDFKLAHVDSPTCKRPGRHRPVDDFRTN
jgi:hypothetical protein